MTNVSILFLPPERGWDIRAPAPFRSRFGQCQDAHDMVDPTRLDRILLHLRCLSHDHKYRWHLSGVWRELRGRKRTQTISPAAA